MKLFTLALVGLLTAAPVVASEYESGQWTCRPKYTTPVLTLNRGQIYEELNELDVISDSDLNQLNAPTWHTICGR